MLTFTKQQTKEIAEQLDLGFKAFFQNQTGELIFVPDKLKHYGMDTEPWHDDIDKLEANFSDYCEVYAMESKDSYRVMADFTEQLTDSKLQDKLLLALDKHKPFREFKFVIDNSGDDRQRWFDYKNNRYIEWTEAQLKRQNARVSLD